MKKDIDKDNVKLKYFFFQTFFLLLCPYHNVNNNHNPLSALVISNVCHQHISLSGQKRTPPMRNQVKNMFNEVNSSSSFL